MLPKYYPRNRKPQNEAAVPFSLKKPLELKSAIMGVGGRERGQVCLYELSLLLACFKQTGFSQIACASEIGDFQKCFYSAKKDIKCDRKGQKRELTSPKDETNKLLKKYSSK